MLPRFLAAGGQGCHLQRRKPRKSRAEGEEGTDGMEGKVLRKGEWTEQRAQDRP